MVEETAKLDPGRFHPAPLPRWERKLSFAVWIVHSLGAFYLAYLACTGPLRLWFNDDLHRSPYIRGWLVDPTDSEWHNFMLNLRWAMWLSRSLSYRFLSADQARLVQIAVGFVLHAWVTSFTCMFVLAAFALITIGLSVHFRREFIAWILCVGFVIKVFDIAPLSADYYVNYREFNMFCYGALKIITVCTAFCRNPERQVSMDWGLSIAHYMTYLPYATVIIILYEEFVAQIAQRTCGQRETPFGWRSNLLFSLRLLLSTTLYTILLHMIPAGAMFASQAATSSRLNGYQLFSLAYVIGQYFHVKYVVLFGVSSLFARIDGMTPPPPPICISRVSRYSRMWRHFDAGLYSFLKNQVYIPLLTNPYLKSGMARPLALVSAFLIVVAWHGSHRNCVVWVCLSAFELVIERSIGLGAGIREPEPSSSLHFQEFRARTGEVWLRRMLACCMNLTVLYNGLLGIAKMDFTIVNGVPSAGLVLAHLLTLGYFFNQTCLELEFANRKVAEKNNNNKDNNNDNNNVKEKLS
ncbi:hypothetical protein PRIPAC_82932 [Pristionchus pacificus]|uniref:Uncharacterized protein n=1 Tax=Pristionchus pacificus TaxID=54126 RepID=A0A2A6BXG2_PRIPA|nr:hypothetical protein PRIPAC_82932 [Pristionchus pacificus]|eukprot:PDM70585.1 hypothetical protein PRIPAC_46831 [Pristionchus pacificus]